MELSEIEVFKKFLDQFGIEHRHGKGEWEVLQVMTEHGFKVIHKNKHGRLTISDKLFDLVNEFHNNGNF